ncbi:DUF6339 family protein [Solimonas sp. K1W22B-7]|uniref:DUF6339 family protein n=1 Tax=Solimonas sp. K1W22B-7 TaxID=2303331 RepID=UPI0013C50130|nr:DUF6339 family protein [Solimonas sp. K1W22B-7]
MIRIKYIKAAALSELQRQTPHILDKYRRPERFLSSFFSGHDDWLAESSLEVDALPALNPGKEGTVEATNAISLHKALRGITESQAADERLWAWFAHEHYWDYMRARWPGEANRAENQIDYIREHYFIGLNVRNLMRQGISRLWWFAHTTVDDTRDDPYELTKVMLEYSDNRQSLMETGYSRNQRMVQTILDRTNHWRSNGHDILRSRDLFRALCKELNLYGGTLILDCLQKEDIVSMIDDFMARKASALESAATSA